MTASRDRVRVTVNLKIAKITFLTLHSSQSAYLPSALHARLLVIPLVLLGPQIPICCPSHMSALHLAPAVSALRLLQSGILSLRPSNCVPALTPSTITSSPTISRRPFNSLSTFLLRLRFGFGWPLCTFTNYINLLTYISIEYVMYRKNQLLTWWPHDHEQGSAGLPH